MDSETTDILRALIATVIEQENRLTALIEVLEDKHRLNPALLQAHIDQITSERLRDARIELRASELRELWSKLESSPKQ